MEEKYNQSTDSLCYIRTKTAAWCNYSCFHNVIFIFFSTFRKKEKYEVSVVETPRYERKKPVRFYIRQDNKTKKNTKRNTK